MNRTFVRGEHVFSHPDVTMIQVLAKEGYIGGTMWVENYIQGLFNLEIGYETTFDGYYRLVTLVNMGITHNSGGFCYFRAGSLDVANNSKSGIQQITPLLPDTSERIKAFMAKPQPANTQGFI